jgi:predicted HAD superfamily Cof-like phosphohydrolase
VNPWQKGVRDFHVALDHPAPDKADASRVRRELRAALILEEALETVAALGFRYIPLRMDKLDLRAVAEPDWPLVLDGLCDLLYVTIGTAVELGIDLDPFFEEVHRANMAKVGGGYDANGKTRKPEGWQPPRIEELWLRAVSAREMTAEEKEAQRRSFAYGNVALSNPDVTRETVDKAAEAADAAEARKKDWDALYLGHTADDPAPPLKRPPALDADPYKYAEQLILASLFPNEEAKAKLQREAFMVISTLVEREKTRHKPVEAPHRHTAACWEHYEACGEHHAHDYTCGNGKLSAKCPKYEGAR